MKKPHIDYEQIVNPTSKGKKNNRYDKGEKIAPDTTASTIVQWNINGIRNNKKINCRIN